MSNIANLKESITQVFQQAIDNGYTKEEIEELLEDIDFHTLAQAVLHNFETVYEYTVDCTLPSSMNYRGPELFPRAVLLYEDAGDCMASFICCARSLELWLLDDASLAVISVFHTNAGHGDFITEYRVYKGDNWQACGMCIDMEDLADKLIQLCLPHYEHQMPDYEV